jgi:hypothetical protein
VHGGDAKAAERVDQAAVGARNILDNDMLAHVLHS